MNINILIRASVEASELVVTEFTEFGTHVAMTRVPCVGEFIQYRNGPYKVTAVFHETNVLAKQHASVHVK